MKQFPNSLIKFLMPYLVVLVAMAVPIFWDSMLSWVPFIIAQGQEASLQERSADGGGLSINRSSNRSANGPISQNALTTGSFGDDRVRGSNVSDIIIGILGADT